MRNRPSSGIERDRGEQPSSAVPWRVPFLVLLVLTALAGYVAVKGWILVRMLTSL